MDPSQEENRGPKRKAPTAAHLLAFANAQIGLAGRKRDANEVSDLEAPEGSRPMLVLDRTRHRPNHPEFDFHQQQPSDAIPLSLIEDGSKSHSDGNELPVPQQQLESSSSPLEPSLPLVVLDPTSNDTNSDVIQTPAATASPPQSITSLSVEEAYNKGRSESKQETQAKLDEAKAEVEELRRRLNPAKFKAAYDRGFREGGIDGYNKYSLNAQTKASEDRQTFEKVCQEKDLALYDQQMIITNYQKELMARRRRIENLEQQATHQNISGQQILEAEARFSAQEQEVAVARNQNSLMRADLGAWQVQWDLRNADFEKSKAAVNTKASQLEDCQRQLEKSARDLQESRDQANKLAAINSELLARWTAPTKELKSKLKVLSSNFNSLKGLVKRLIKVAAERSAEIKLVKAINEELKGDSEQIKDGKEEIIALTSKNKELVKARDDLENSVARQNEELKDLSAEKDELTRTIREIEEKDERAAPNPDITISQSDAQEAEEIDDLLSVLAPETAAADVELVRVMVERERANTEAENIRRENRITASLEEMEETEQRRRQLLVDELADKDAQLYDAQQQIRELNGRLLAASPSQPSQSPPSAPSANQPPPPTVAPSAPSQSRSWFRLFSPRRLLIILFIFFLAFLLPYFHPSGGRPSATEDINSGQVDIEVLPLPAEAVVVSVAEAYDERRRQILAWGMENWERNERIFRGEEPRPGDDEYRPLPGLTF